MNVYRIIFGDKEIQIPRSDIVATKKLIKAGGNPGYNEMINLMSHPVAIARYSLIPGTNLLRFFMNTCIFLGRILIVLAIGLLFGRFWWWSLSLIVFCFFVLSNIQTMINYEIGSRLFTLDQRLGMDLFTEQVNQPDHDVRLRRIKMNFFRKLFMRFNVHQKIRKVVFEKYDFDLGPSPEGPIFTMNDDLTVSRLREMQHDLSNGPYLIGVDVQKALPILLSTGKMTEAHIESNLSDQVALSREIRELVCVDPEALYMLACVRAISIKSEE